MTIENSALPMLRIDGLGFRFGSRVALENIDFSVARGEFKVLLGPNGAGKTTLFSLVTRLYESKVGEILVNGANLNREPLKALARMGVVFQQPTLDLDLTVRQNMRYHAALHGLSRREADDRMVEELERLGMSERLDERVRDLNGGHRRRVEIARALMHRPRLLLLDEPTVGLDVPTRHDIVHHVHDLAKENGISVLWATHLIDEVFDGDSVIVLHKGRKLIEGTRSDVVAKAGARDLEEAFNLLTRESEAA